MKIAMFSTKKYDKDCFERHNKEYNYEIKYYEAKLCMENIILAKGYDVVCVFVNDTLNKDVLDKLNEYGIKLIALRCAGFNNVDINNLGNIKAVRVPDYSPYAVAEHTVGLILSLNRKIYKAYNRTRDHNFLLDGLMGFDLNGKTVGVIGTGKIGSVFAKIMNGFGCKVIAYDKYPNKDLEQSNIVKYVTLEELYKESNIISLHCPLTEETKGMINKETISTMKNNMLINTSRGGLINTRDLLNLMVQEKNISVGLDVYEEEGNIFFENLEDVILNDKVLSLLLTLPNVVVTSHQAYFTKEALHNISVTTFNNIDSYMNKNILENSIN